MSIVERPSPDAVITGGTVMDPETGLNEKLDVEITGGTITGLVAPGSTQPNGATLIDAAGGVVTAGFIDMHSHGMNPSTMMVQAADGVTTALELESGSAHILDDIRKLEDHGAPINFGFSAAWALARMEVMDSVSANEGFMSFVTGSHGARWKMPGTAKERDKVLARVETQIEHGALGIGILVGYAPETGAVEYTNLAHLAKQYELPTFSHARHKYPDEPGSATAGALELIGAAAGTGAHMHMCHINSTALRHMDAISDMIDMASSLGSRVTTEAYPYGAGMTTLAASFLAPEHLSRFGLQPWDITIYPSGERPQTLEQLAHLRSEIPNATAVIHYLEEGNRDDDRHIDHILQQPHVVIASDAIPYMNDAGAVITHGAIGHGAISHPRTAGTFIRFIQLMKDRLGLMECLRRCSLLPANVLSDASIDFSQKGRIQVGMDADILVLDEQALKDQATYDEPWRRSLGITHVLVAGEFVINDGQSIARPTSGRAITNNL